MSSTLDTLTGPEGPKGLPRFTPAGGTTVSDAYPDAPLLHLLAPKWLTARARALAGEKGRTTRFVLLAVMGLFF